MQSVNQLIILLFEDMIENTQVLFLKYDDLVFRVKDVIYFRVIYKHRNFISSLLSSNNFPRTHGLQSSEAF